MAQGSAVPPPHTHTHCAFNALNVASELGADLVMCSTEKQQIPFSGFSTMMGLPCVFITELHPFQA